MLHPAVKVIQLIYLTVSENIALSSFKQIFETSRNSWSQMFQDDAAVLIGETYYIISPPSAKNSRATTWEEQIQLLRYLKLQFIVAELLGEGLIFTVLFTIMFTLSYDI